MLTQIILVGVFCVVSHFLSDSLTTSHLPVSTYLGAQVPALDELYMSYEIDRGLSPTDRARRNSENREILILPDLQIGDHLSL